MVASCPSLRCSCRKWPVWCREAEGLVTELWFPRFVTMQWLCSESCYLTAANQWTLVEIELLATVGWKWGCQPFSCRCSLNVTQCQRRLAGHVCLRFFLEIPIIHSLPEASGSWERQNAPPALHYGCILPIPSLQLQKIRNVSHAKKQSVWSRSYGFKICYNTVIVLSVVLWNCCKPTNTCRDWAFSNSGLEVGLPAFQLFVGHVCFFRNPFPPFILGIPSIHYLPEASGSWQRQYAPPALHYGCIMPIPSLQLQKRNVPHAKKQSVWSRSYGFKICYNTVIVISVVLWNCCKPTNTCRDWAFSNSGLEVGLPAFQLQRRFARQVCLRNPFPPFLLGISIIHSLPEASGSWERQYAPPALHYGCIMPIPSLQLHEKPVS